MDRKYLSFLPGWFQTARARLKIQLSIEPSKDLVIKRAETIDEVRDVFRFIDEHDQQGISKFHVLPTTSSIMVTKNGVLEAVALFFVDSGLGLPIEENWDLSVLKKESVRIVELRPVFKCHRNEEDENEWIWSFYKFVFQYSQLVLGAETLVVQDFQQNKTLYKGVLLFNEFKGLPTNPENFNSPAYFVRVDENYQEDLKYSYAKMPENKNLYRYLFHDPLSEKFVLPVASAKNFGGFVFSPEQLEQFFKSYPDVEKSLTNKDKSVLANVYFQPEYRLALNLQSSVLEFERHQQRFLVLFRSRLCIRASGRLMMASVLEVSRNGLKIRTGESQTLYAGEEITLSVEMSPQNNVNLRGKILWVESDKNLLGIGLETSIPEKWKEFIDSLELPATASSIQYLTQKKSA